MKTYRLHLVLLGVAALFIWGCGYDQTAEVEPASTSGTETSHDGDAHAATGEHAEGTAATSGVICGMCGESKGTDACCAADAEKCSCGMIKGSALCCVELAEEFKGKDFCGKCGQVAGSESCCAKDAEVCEGCKLHKGAPLCCKLKPAGDADDK